jgi:hypothetical protein
MLEVIHYLQGLQVHPVAGVTVAALLAALIQQRLARARTPDFSTAYRDLDLRALGATKPRPPPTTFHD